jgi:hypothetical protein
MAKKSARVSNYENNPFFIATNGITILFTMARGIAVVLIILSVVMSLSDGGSSTGETETVQKSIQDIIETLSGWTLEQWLQAAGTTTIIGLALLMVSSLFGGVSSYASAELAKGHQVSIKDAFSIAFNNLWSYAWLQIIIFTKIFLWSLLFVLPGIYFAFRYSLAGVAFYDTKKNLRGNAAIKESLKLTKNGWLTTLGSNMLFYLITFGVLGMVVSTSVNTVLYRQFQEAGDKKPEAHWLSWLALFLLAVMLVSLVVWFLFGFPSGLAQK